MILLDCDQCSINTYTLYDITIFQIERSYLNFTVLEIVDIRYRKHQYQIWERRIWRQIYWNNTEERKRAWDTEGIDQMKTQPYTITVYQLRQVRWNSARLFLCSFSYKRQYKVWNI